MMKDIFEYFSFVEDNYLNGSIEVTNGLEFSMYQTIRTIDFYTNDAFLNGEKDDLGRDKPFKNIVNSAVRVATRATDMDTKDIDVRTDNPQKYASTFLIRHELENWMKETGYAKTLNVMGQIRARYGGLLVKRVERDNQIYIEIPEWQNVFVDPADIDNGAIVERHYMSATQIAKKRGVWENVDECLEYISSQANSSDRKHSYKENNKNHNESKLVVYEIEAELPETFMPEKKETGDKYTFSLQKHFITMHGDKKLVLFSEEIDSTKYKYLPWERVSGRSLGRGVVEDGFQAQMWINDAAIKEMRMLEWASKVVPQTNDESLYENILTDIDDGQTIFVGDGKEFSLTNLTSPAIPRMSEIKEEWENNYEKTTSTFPGITGEQMPSNTPLGSVQIQSQAARSIYEYRREEMGIFQEEIMNEWVLPFILKKVDGEHILSSNFSPDELKIIDESFSNDFANEQAKKLILSGKIVTPQEYESFRREAEDFLMKNGSTRFINIPKGFYKDFKAYIVIDPTGEKDDKVAMLETLKTILQFMQNDPTIMDDPRKLAIFSRMAEMAGVSPVLLQRSNTTPPDQSLLEQTVQTADQLATV